jgi:hypothetical protein
MDKLALGRKYAEALGCTRKPWPSGQGFWCYPTPGFKIDFEGRRSVIGGLPELLEMGTPKDFKQGGLVGVNPLH